MQYCLRPFLIVSSLRWVLSFCQIPDNFLVSPQPCPNAVPRLTPIRSFIEPNQCKTCARLFLIGSVAAFPGCLHVYLFSRVRVQLQYLPVVRSRPTLCALTTPHLPSCLAPLFLFSSPNCSNDQQFNSEGQAIGTNRSGNSLEVSAASGKNPSRTMEEEEAAKRDRLTSL